MKHCAIILLILALLPMGCGMPFNGAGQAGNGSQITVRQHGHEYATATNAEPDEFTITFGEDGKIKEVKSVGVFNYVNIESDQKDGGAFTDPSVEVATTQPASPTPSPVP